MTGMKSHFKPFRLWTSMLALAAGSAHGLYTREAVTAFRVDDDAFVIDGKPDSLWRSIFSVPNGNRTISFDDYGKMVLLQPDLRNGDPSRYVPNPPAGSATLMAAYDSKALYFFMLVKAPSLANPAALNCAAEDVWKSDAAEIFVDPSPWSADPLVYRSYFTTDASGIFYGTSPRTIQIDKPVSARENRVFYRNRAVSDRFQQTALPAQVTVAASPRTASDTAWVGVEMRIPFWSAASDFAPDRNLFLSWGFNLYGDSARADCAGNPLAYRWAKHFLDYAGLDQKPPGWKSGDSTHYDPTRSWDGWGQLSLRNEFARNQCRSTDSKDVFEANWNADYWRSACFMAVTTNRRYPLRLDAAGRPMPLRAPGRDARGRLTPSAFPAFVPPERDARR